MVKLNLSDQKTERILIINSWKKDILSMRVVNHKNFSKLVIRYLKVMIDVKLGFKLGIREGSKLQFISNKKSAKYRNTEAQPHVTYRSGNEIR